MTVCVETPKNSHLTLSRSLFLPTLFIMASLRYSPFSLYCHQYRTYVLYFTSKSFLCIHCEERNCIPLSNGALQTNKVLRSSADRVYLILVLNNKLLIRKPILNAYKTHQKLHTLILTYRLFKRFQRGGGGAGLGRRARGSVT